jgi:hypothetical protein
MKSRLLISPHSVYFNTVGLRYYKNINLGGILLKSTTCCCTPYFDGFRFYLSFLILLPYFQDTIDFSNKLMPFVYPGLILLKNNPYSRLPNYLIGFLSLKNKYGPHLIIQKSRFAINSLIYYKRKNIDSY